MIGTFEKWLCVNIKINWLLNVFIKRKIKFGVWELFEKNDKGLWHQKFEQTN